MRHSAQTAVLILIVGFVAAPSVTAQLKPFTQNQVQEMVRAGFADDSGAKLIEQRGIDFAPTEDLLLNLKAGGANDLFLAALRSSKHPQSTKPSKPLDQVQVIALVAAEVPSSRVAILVQQNGIDFEPTDDYLHEVRAAGGGDELIDSLKSAKVTKTLPGDAEAATRQLELKEHVARGAELLLQRAYQQAEGEYRAALLIDSDNPDLHVGLSRALSAQSKADEALAEAREALRLNPESDMGHYSLGTALRGSGDLANSLSELREALRLNPNNDLAHNALGITLERQGDLDGAISEYHEALRLNQSNDSAHSNLAMALVRKSDWDGALAECREALRLNPNSYPAHTDLGIILMHSGDQAGAVAQFREALRLNAGYTAAHVELGLALLKGGDAEGAIEEERDALQQSPGNATAHFYLGAGLEKSNRQQEALAEYRAAYELKPSNPDFRKAYNRLLQSQTGQVQESQNEAPPAPTSPTRHLVKVKLASGRVVVPPAKYLHARFSVDPLRMQPADVNGTQELAVVVGNFSVSGGSKNDIEVLLLNEEQFNLFNKGQRTATVYSSGKASQGQIRLGISEPGTYYFVLSNIFSLVSTKYVTAEVELRYLTAE